MTRPEPPLRRARRGGLPRGATADAWDDWLHPRQTSTVPVAPNPPDRPTQPREAVQRWRLVLERGPLEAGAGQREQLAAWEAALVASGLPAAGLDATPPRARVAHAAPLAAAIPGEAELADVWLTERLPAWRVREALAASIPDGWRLVEVYDVWPGAPALPGQVVASVYRATLAGATDTERLRTAARSLLDATTLPRERQKGDGVVRYDLRPFLDAIEVARDPAAEHGEALTLRMTLRHDPERGIGRPDETLAALADAYGAALEVRALVRESLVLAAPVVAQPAPPRGPRPRQGRGQADAGASTSRPRK